MIQILYIFVIYMYIYSTVIVMDLMSVFVQWTYGEFDVYNFGGIFYKFSVMYLKVCFKDFKSSWCKPLSRWIYMLQFLYKNKMKYLIFVCVVYLFVKRIT